MRHRKLTEEGRRQQAKHDPASRQEDQRAWIVAIYSFLPNGPDMSIPLDVLEAELLQLPRHDRIRVLDCVVSSLDADAARDARWDELAKQRQIEAESDPDCLLPLDQVLAQLRIDLR